MTENQNQPFFLEVTPDQADALHVMETHQAQQKIIELAGRVILQKEIYGVEVEATFDGNTTPIAIANLTARDMGTRIIQSKNRGYFPTIEEGWSALQSAKALPLQEEENHSFQTAQPPEQLTEEISAADRELQALQEWGLSADATSEDALIKLRSTLQDSEALTEGASRLAAEWDTTASNLRVHLTHSQMLEAQSLLSDFYQKLNQARESTDLFNTTDFVQPQATRSAFANMTGNIGAFAEAISGRYGPIEGEMMYGVLARLEQENVGLSLFQTHTRLQEAVRESITKLGEQNHGAIEPDERLQYASGYIEDLAQALQKDGSPEALDRAVMGVRQFIADNPQLYTQLDRIERDSEKSRSGGEKQGEKTDSKTYAAEIAIDLLTGKFSYGKMGSDPIRVYSNGNIQGQHRAAALTTLYGNNWQAAAKKLGFIIENINEK